MLQGSLDNFTIPEILGLLASTTKTGRLKISGDRGTGSIWCGDGKLEYAEASKLDGPHGIDDVMLELLRYQSGNFSFHADEALPDGADASSEEVETVLAGAATRLEEWYSIEAVVPSLGHSLTPVATLATKDVTLDADEWEFLVAIGDACSVGDVASRLGLGEIDVSRRAKGLIERELVEITEHPNRRASDLATDDASVEAGSDSDSADSVESVDAFAADMAVEEPQTAEATPVALDELVDQLPAVEPIAFDDPAPAALDSTFAADSGVAPISFADPAPEAADPLAETDSFPADGEPTAPSFAEALAETVGDSAPAPADEVGLTSSIFEPAPVADPAGPEPTDLASLRESILSEDETGTDTSVLMQFLNDDR